MNAFAVDFFVFAAASSSKRAALSPEPPCACCLAVWAPLSSYLAPRSSVFVFGGGGFCFLLLAFGSQYSILADKLLIQSARCICALIVKLIKGNLRPCIDAL